MVGPPKNQSLQALYQKVGEALSQWTAVEIQVYQIFGITLSLTVKQSGGGWSGTSTAPAAVLSAIESFQAKLKMVTVALEDALASDRSKANSEGIALIDDWQKLKKRVDQLSGNRNKLAHWTAAGIVGDRGAPRVGLIPPPYSSKYQEFVANRVGAVTETDISDWREAFQELSIDLSQFADRLAGHRDLHFKHIGQVVEQCLVDHQQDRTLLDYVERLISESR